MLELVPLPHPGVISISLVLAASEATLLYFNLQKKLSMAENASWEMLK